MQPIVKKVVLPRIGSAVVLPSLIAVTLIAVTFLVVAARAEAGSYYVGGGEGVHLAVRVVDRQVVWAKLHVRQHCDGDAVAHASSVAEFEGLIGPVAVASEGSFSRLSDRQVHTRAREEINRQDISGRIGPKRLVGKLLYFLRFKSRRGPERGSVGRCWSGSGRRGPERIAVPIVARRVPEPAGVRFYFGPDEGGIRTYFETRGRRIVRAEVAAVHYCTGGRGKRYVVDEIWPFFAPIPIGPAGGFHDYEAPDEIRPLQILKGRVEPDRIVGTYGFAQRAPGGTRCRTGSFEPRHDGTWALPFTAPLR